jgi:hypothetical protein
LNSHVQVEAEPGMPALHLDGVRLTVKCLGAAMGSLHRWAFEKGQKVGESDGSESDGAVRHPHAT